MEKIKLDMFCIVVLLFFSFRTVASSHVKTDCSPSIKNISCDCSNISLSCHGIQEDYLDFVELVTNITDSFHLEKNFSVDITIENITLNSGSSFKNVTISSLKLGSGLSDLPGTIFYGIDDSLQVLNLRSNNFDTVPSGALMTLKQLHTLDLSHNNISTISKNDFKGLDNLRTLNLEYNMISIIESDAFLNLSLLQMLYLDHNNLVSLNSSGFNGLSSLNQLSISENGFDTLMFDSFTILPSLKTLHANKNSLMVLENIQIDSMKLQELSVQHCAIQGPLKKDSLKSLPGLISADLSYNNITEIQSSALAASYHLEHLDLSYNSIRKLQENAFSALFNLITLDLQHNAVQIVPKNAFYNLTNLKYLNLNNNNLHAFLCQYTASLFSLERLHLENNQIKVINSGAFIYSQNLTELKLAGNDLNCSCIIYDFAKYLHNHARYFKSANIFQCTSVFGKKNLIEIDFNPLHCKSELPCLSPSIEDRTSEEHFIIYTSKAASDNAVNTAFNSTHPSYYEESYVNYSDVHFTTHSNELTTSNHSASSHISQNDTTSIGADNHSFTLSQREIFSGILITNSSGLLVTYYNESHFSSLNYSNGFPVSQSNSSALVTTNQSITVDSSVSFSYSFTSNSTDSGEILITAHYENGSYTANYSNSLPVSQSYAAVFGKTLRPMKPINITYFNILTRESDLAVIEWTVNRKEPQERCVLKLGIISNNETKTEKNFICISNSYILKSVELGVMYKICLSIMHLIYNNVSVCRHHVFEPSAMKLADHPNHTYLLIAVISLLIIVMCFIILLAVRNIWKSKKASGWHSVTNNQTEDSLSLGQVSFSFSFRPS